MLAISHDSPYLSVVNSIKNGSPSESEDALALLESELSSEKYLAKRFLEPGEADQAVRLGILYGAKAYKEEDGVPVLPFLRLVIRRTVDNESYRPLLEVEAFGSLNDSTKNFAQFDSLSHQDPGIKAIEDRMLISAARELLTEPQNKFIDALIEHDCNSHEAARSLGLTPEAGRKMLSRIRATLQASSLAA